MYDKQENSLICSFVGRERPLELDDNRAKTLSFLERIENENWDFLRI